MKTIFFILVLLKGFTLFANEVEVPVGSATLFCRTMGEGDPLIVIHGGGALNLDYLLPHMERLAKGNLVIFYDQRGCGRSAKDLDLELVTIESFVEDLESVRKAFGFEKVSILGHSWGALLAMQYAIAHPESIEKLILSNTMPASSEELLSSSAERQKRLARYQEEKKQVEEIEEFKRGDPEAIEKLYRAFFLGYCYDPAIVNLLNLRMTPEAFFNGSKVYFALRAELLAEPYSLYGALESLRIPTLILYGDDDPLPPYVAELIHRHIPNSKFVLLEKCGHFPYAEQPEIYFSLIEEFLKP